jgi:hypothetical protein
MNAELRRKLNRITDIAGGRKLYWPGTPQLFSYHRRILVPGEEKVIRSAFVDFR